MYEIEKGIPIPPVKKQNQYRGSRVETAFTFTIKELNVGESFVCEKEKSCISGAISRLKGTDKEFTVRQTEDNKYRIWRTK